MSTQGNRAGLQHGWGGQGSLTNLYGHSPIQKPSSLAESRNRRDTDESSGRGDTGR